MNDKKITDAMMCMFPHRLGTVDYRVYISLLILNCECIIKNIVPKISLKELGSQALVSTVSSVSRSTHRLERYGLIKIVGSMSSGKKVYVVSSLHSIKNNRDVGNE